MENIWKAIEDFPNYYVSAKGEVKSIKGFILKPIYDHDGYTKVSLKHRNGKIYSKRIHILVAEAFIPNPEGKPVVNHKNNIKDDNRFENLEWATVSENTLHAYREGFIEHPQNRPVAILDSKGDTVGVFKNNREASKALKVNPITFYKYRDENKLLYGSLRIVEVESANKNHPLYNREIIKESDGSLLNSKPLKCTNGKLYRSIAEAAIDLDLNEKTVSRYMRIGETYLGLGFMRITPYDYLLHEYKHFT